MENSRQRVMEATMDIVALQGMSGLNMRQVADQAGIKAATIYNYFESKDQLLYECFLLVNRQIAGLFENCEKSEKAAKGTKIIDFAHNHWVRYFRFMVANGNRSLFYYSYRESSHLHEILIRNNETVANDMKGFSELFEPLLSMGLKAKGMDEDFFWLFVLEGTGNFVKRIIRDSREISDEEIEQIWKLLTNGILGFFR